MRLKFKRGIQRKLFSEIKNRENLSERKLANLIHVKRSTLSKWIREENCLPADIFEKLLFRFPYIARYKLM